MLRAIVIANLKDIGANNWKDTMKFDRTVKATLIVIAFFLGIIAFDNLPTASASKQTFDQIPKFDHVDMSVVYGGVSFFDKRTGDVWLYKKQLISKKSSNQKRWRNKVTYLGRITKLGEPLE